MAITFHMHFYTTFFFVRRSSEMRLKSITILCLAIFRSPTGRRGYNNKRKAFQCAQLNDIKVHLSYIKDIYMDICTSCRPCCHLTCRAAPTVCRHANPCSPIGHCWLQGFTATPPSLHSPAPLASELLITP